MKKPNINSIDETSAAWSERLRAGNNDRRLREEFEAWINADTLHKAAYSRIENARTKVRAVASAPEILNVRHKTLARVVNSRSRFSRLTYMATAASVILFTALALWYFIPFDSRQETTDVATSEPDYKTAIGERLAATLEDGSVLTLNTESSAVVTFNPNERLVTLNIGQALFEVAKDKTRPFIVIANGKRITAVGTAFDVRLTDEDIVVTLLEGQITIEPVNPEKEALWTRADLEAGQQLITTQTTPLIVQQADIGRLLSWRYGQAIFEDEPLATAVEEMNRYVQRKIELGDDRLKNLKISGAFKTGRVDVFIEALTAYFPMTIKNTTDERIVLTLQE